MTDKNAHAPPAQGQHAWEGEFFRLLAENTKDYGIIVIDVGGDVLAWSPGAEAILGYTAEEMIGTAEARIFTPEDIENGVPAKEVAVALENGRAADERWHVRKDGTRFWCSGVLTLLKDEHGQLRGLAKVLRDLTAQKHAQDATHESEERLRVALSAARMGTWFWNVATNRQSLDDNLKRLTGLPPDGDVRTIEEFIELIRPEDQDVVRNAFEGALRDGSDLSVEFRVTWPDGTVHWLQDQGKVLRDSAGNIVSVTGACVDVTERKHLEEALHERAKQLADADRNKDEFLAMLGHELRNPLTPIRSVLEVLRREQLQGEKLDRAYATIERQVEQLTRLVDDLLDVSRITRGMIHLHTEVVDLNTIVHNAIETVRPLVDARSHSLMVSLPIHPVWISADPTRLTQVLTNLLHNAVKYTDVSGRVWLSAEREGDEVVIRVRDTGTGMAPDLLPKVFDLFTQGERSLDRSQGGLGIGLTLVRTLVEMHGGTAQAKSEGPGKGSELIVRLPAPPIAHAPPVALPVRAAAPAGDPSRPRRILVVDDNFDVAESLAMLLQGLHYKVEMAHDGRRAVEVAQSFQPDVVLLDIGLPGMNGYEVAKELRRRPSLREVLLLALSGYGQEEDRRRSEEAGFDYHLVKPVSWPVLESLISTAGSRKEGMNG